MIKNIYPEEQAMIDEALRDELLVAFKIGEVLDTYGYELIPTLSDGLPEIELVRL